MKALFLTVGSVLGVLFAPAMGKDTRKKILNSGEDLTESLRIKINELLDELAKEELELNKKAHDFVDKVKVKI